MNLRHEPSSVWEQRDTRLKAIAAGMGVPSRFEAAVAVVVARRRARAVLRECMRVLPLVRDTKSPAEADTLRVEFTQFCAENGNES